MNLRRHFYAFQNSCGTHWRLNRQIYMWFAICLAVGIGIAITVVSNPKFAPTQISESILDVNIQKAVRPNTGLGAMMMARIFMFAFYCIVAFILCLKKWSSTLIFVFIAYKGFEITVNLYWAITKFGMATGLVLFIAYLVNFTILLIITLAMIIYCLRLCEPVRMGGRCPLNWNEIFYTSLKFFGALVIFCLCEFIIYWVVLSKLVFVV